MSVSSSWNIERFGALVDHSAFGPRFSGDAYSDDGNVATLRTTDLDNEGRIDYARMPRAVLDQDKFRNHLLCPNDLVITRSGTCGIAAVFEGYEIPVLPGAFLIRFRLGERADPHYFRYYFNSPSGRELVLSVARGAVQQNLNLTNLEALRIPVPPVKSQVRIAARLRTYDDLIENNRRRMALLEESARLLYREWFVHLRFPGHESTRIAGGLPAGWEKKHIGDFIAEGLVDLQTGPFGTQLKASHYTEEGTPVINVRNIGYGHLRPDKLEFVPEDVAERLAVHILRPDDIVFGRKGAVDRHLLITSAQEGWMQGSDCIRLRALSEQVCPILFSFAFREPGHHNWMLTQCGNKATMASLNQDVIARIPALVPCDKILQEFQAYARDTLNQIANLAQQNQRLKNARDLLLPKLLSGELSI